MTNKTKLKRAKTAEAKRKQELAEWKPNIEVQGLTTKEAIWFTLAGIGIMIMIATVIYQFIK